MFQRIRRSFRRKRASYCVTCETENCGRLGCNRNYENVYYCSAEEIGSLKASRDRGRRSREDNLFAAAPNGNEYIIGGDSQLWLDEQSRKIRAYYRQQVVWLERVKFLSICPSSQLVTFCTIHNICCAVQFLYSYKRLASQPRPQKLDNKIITDL